MGCHQSKLDHADDSIHVMLAHAMKANGGHQNHYVPRQPHPLLREQPPTSATESDGESQTEMDRLLYHAAHHNDTIDPRDLEDYGLQANEE